MRVVEDVGNKDVVEEYTMGISEEDANQIDEEKCEHDWENDKETTVSSLIREGDFLGFPVHCTKCGIKAIEWFEYSYIEIKER